jgi:hypothetical protein
MGPISVYCYVGNGSFVCETCFDNLVREQSLANESLDWEAAAKQVRADHDLDVVYDVETTPPAEGDTCGVCMDWISEPFCKECASSDADLNAHGYCEDCSSSDGDVPDQDR